MGEIQEKHKTHDMSDAWGITAIEKNGARKGAKEHWEGMVPFDFNTEIWEGLPEVTIEQNLKDMTGVISRRRAFQCKDPGVGGCLRCSTNNQEVKVPGLE